MLGYESDHHQAEVLMLVLQLVEIGTMLDHGMPITRRRSVHQHLSGQALIGDDMTVIPDIVGYLSNINTPAAQMSTVN